MVVNWKKRQKLNLQYPRTESKEDIVIVERENEE